MQTNKKKDYITKILHVAIIFFATTIGIGLYALVGPSIKNSTVFNALSNFTSNIGAVGSSLISNIDFGDSTKISDGEVVVKISSKSNAFHSLKTTLIDSNIAPTNSVLVKLQLNSKEIGFPEFLNYISDIKPGESLNRMMGDSRYYINKDEEYTGTIVVSILDPEITFASLMDFEGKFIEGTLPLVRPMISKNDISMYIKLGTVSRQVIGVDSRVIIGAKEEIIYIWGIYKNHLIIADSKDSFSKIVDALK